MLFLLADTGSGHRAAATAVQQALERSFPGAFTPIFCDPLIGPEAHPWVRRLATLYGPVVRRAPWLWSMLYHGTDRHPIAPLLAWLVRTFTTRPVRQAVARHGPRLLVSFHPLPGGCVADARRVTGTRAMTVVTDLVTGHCTWRRNDADLVVVPSRAMQAWYLRAGWAASRCVDLGLPVAAAFGAGPLPDAARLRLRRRLGLGGSRFVVVLTGGSEGAAKLGRQARALLRRLPDIDVVAICGRNERVRRSLERFAVRTGARLAVRAYVDNMADWVPSADMLVTKAGPGHDRRGYLLCHSAADHLACARTGTRQRRGAGRGGRGPPGAGHPAPVARSAEPTHRSGRRGRHVRGVRSAGPPGSRRRRRPTDSTAGHRWFDCRGLLRRYGS